MKHRGTDLTQGPILSHLFRLALPTIGASFMQMTYNLTDMLWLGRVGEEAVAAVGAAGFYVWFGLSLLLVTRVGAEVGVSQSLGSRQNTTALRFVRHALFWSLVISALYSAFTFFGADALMAFLGFIPQYENKIVAATLHIFSLDFPLMLPNPTFL